MGFNLFKNTQKECCNEAVGVNFFIKNLIVKCKIINTYQIERKAQSILSKGREIFRKEKQMREG